MSRSSGAGLVTSFHARRRRRLSIAVVVGALLAGLLSTGAAAAPPPLTFDINIGDGCFAGTARPDTVAKFVVRDGAGKLLGKGTGQIWDGYWDFCDLPGSIRPGWTIKVTLFNEHGTVVVKTATVPLITIRVDRDTDVVSGKGPAGKTLQVGVSDGRWDHWNDSYDVTEDVAVNGAGEYSHGFGADGIDLLGGAQVAVSWHNAANTVNVWRYAEVPRLLVHDWLGVSSFEGATRPNGHVGITLKDGASNVVANGHAVGSYPSGDLYGEFADEDGERYAVQGGEWLSAPAIGPDVDWQVPTGVNSVSVATDKVRGECFPNGRYYVYARDVDWNFEGVKYGNAADNGAFTKDMTSELNIKRNYIVEVVCWTPSGDVVSDAVRVH